MQDRDSAINKIVENLPTAGGGIIGSATGAAIPIGVGIMTAVEGAELGIIAGAWGGPVGIVAGAIIGAIAGGVFGYYIKMITIDARDEMIAERDGQINALRNQMRQQEDARTALQAQVQQQENVRAAQAQEIAALQAQVQQQEDIRATHVQDIAQLRTEIQQQATTIRSREQENINLKENLELLRALHKILERRLMKQEKAFKKFNENFRKLEAVLKQQGCEIDLGGVEVDAKDDEDLELEELRTLVEDSVTLSEMKDPVVADDGRTYERSQLQKWYNQCVSDGRPPTCPNTRIPLTNPSDLKENRDFVKTLSTVAKLGLFSQTKLDETSPSPSLSSLSSLPQPSSPPPSSSSSSSSSSFSPGTRAAH